MQLPERSHHMGPLTFEVLAAFLINQLGIRIPRNAAIVNGERVVEGKDIVRADAGTDIAHLTLVQMPASEVIRPYLDERPSALNPLPDAPHATVWTLRRENVHRTYMPRPDVLLCYFCRTVVEQARL